MQCTCIGEQCVCSGPYHLQDELLHNDWIAGATTAKRLQSDQEKRV
jgi:hypothetical protein